MSYKVDQFDLGVVARVLKHDVLRLDWLGGMGDMYRGVGASVRCLIDENRCDGLVGRRRDGRTERGGGRDIE